MRHELKGVYKERTMAYFWQQLSIFHYTIKRPMMPSVHNHVAVLKCANISKEK
jgi:hypothetical protein